MAERPDNSGQNNLQVPMGPIYRAEHCPPRMPIQPAAGPSWAVGVHQLPVQPAPSTPWLRGNWICSPRYPQPPPPPPYVPRPGPGPSSYQQPPSAPNWVRVETQPQQFASPQSSNSPARLQQPLPPEVERDAQSLLSDCDRLRCAHVAPMGREFAPAQPNAPFQLGEDPESLAMMSTQRFKALLTNKTQGECAVLRTRRRLAIQRNKARQTRVTARLYDQDLQQWIAD
ncbi:basic salivary proline-rich protein 4-like protein [Lates japonicus]|uniref:Basic salivary proline-rich protein 4-like protein n=1 Tax=Lates japonicus TaxID=270547 RepID=A0AAD3N958_LATJO|nr:basic salivary proline-rich protein 4-like protein [Lates japonicus]GLD68185.1 basic salivary proline-rich protein 4-like protein [Lates japonicus]GLD73322.1 basic salivary proline-rich protein 4-like protein [Lates japonicus]